MKIRKMFMTAALCLAAGMAGAQKPPMGHEVYDGWQRVTNVRLSADGSVLTYGIDPQEGDSETVIRRVLDGREIRIPRAASVSMDGTWAYCLVKPPFQTVRQAKIDKKKDDQMPKDSLAVINLKTLEIRKFENVKSFKSGTDAKPFVAYKYDKGIVVLNPATEAVDTLRHGDQFVFSRDGRHLALTLKKDKKDSLSRDEIVLYDLVRMEKNVLDADKPYYGGLAFDDTGRQLVWLASTDSVKDGNKHCALMLSKDGLAPETIVPQDYVNDRGWTFNENSAPYFSRSGNRLFAGIAPFVGPKDSTIVDFETARLDIWNWDAILTPPMQKVRRQQIANRTYPTVIDLSAPVPVLLSDRDFEVMTLSGGGDGEFALSVDNAPYRLASYWDSNPYNDISLISLKDGSRTTVATRLPGRMTLSPGGKYLIWYDCEDLQWHTHEIATGKQVNLTAGCGVAFYEEDDDHPSYPDAYDSRPTWTAGDEYVLICDRYDIWRFRPDGSEAVSLTKGVGRENRVRFRKASPVDYGFTATDRKLGLTHVPAAGEQLWFTAFDEAGKQNGLAVVSGFKPQVPVWFVKDVNYPVLTLARDASVLAFTEGNYRHPYDLRLVFDASKKGLSKGAFNLKPSLQERMDGAMVLTAVNPQQADYRWGDVQLVHWNAYDGTPLDGLLFVPEDLQPGEKIPMIVYFYEKDSETLYNYRAPAPSRSTINVPMYVSNGYAVFVPDIVYNDGHPGESAYNCICSGAEAMCRQFDFLDRDRMAIQGQSWGGYQVAYLVTRTDMFKAGGAGAPVGNMTSAYGGIRWESGMARAMQYEHGQSRIGKSMWEDGGLELYIENSPIFHVDKVSTPVLIMANDADGAVPWYQGIEFFSNLRRFGKPAWLLQYNDEAHNLVERRNCKDLSIRLQQFFDHYLKDEPMPVWMKSGIPTHRKGQDFGFEYAE